MENRTQAELVAQLAIKGHTDEALMWANADLNWSDNEFKKIGMFFDAATELESKLKTAGKAKVLVDKAWSAFVKKVPGICRYVSKKPEQVKQTMVKVETLGDKFKEASKKLKDKSSEVAKEAYKQKVSIARDIVKLVTSPVGGLKVTLKIMTALAKKVTVTFIKVVIKAFKYLWKRKAQKKPLTGFQKACDEIKGTKKASVAKRVPVPCCRN